MRVIIVDDHQLLRSALRTFVEESFSDVTTDVCKDVAAAFDLISKQPPYDLMLLDLGLPGEAGVSALRRIREHVSDLDVIIITGNTDDAVEAAVYREGAKGYVRKDASTTELRRVIEVIFASKASGTSPGTSSSENSGDGALWTPSATAHQTHAQAERASRVPFPSLPLTPRQRDVAALLMEGKSSKEIALQLGLAEQTVKQYSQVIFQLLGVKNRTLAAIKLRDRYQ